MHEHAILLNRFFQSLQDHDHEITASCYHPSATFQDIAFDLHGKKKIHAMWHMISETDLVVSHYQIAGINNSHSGSATWSAIYTYRDTNRKVHNELRSTFTFSDGLIISQHDDCNSWKWGIQALGPVKGPLAWLIPPIRRRKAAAKIVEFIKRHPQYS